MPNLRASRFNQGQADRYWHVGQTEKETTMDALDRRDTENRIVIQSHMFENVGLLMMIALAVVAVLCIIQIILLAAGSPAGTWANDAYYYGTSAVTFLL